MRRLAVILTLLAVTFAGATAATAASTTGPLGKITVEGNAGEKPTLKFNAPFSVSKTVDEELAAGTGDKLVKDQKITFDFVVVDGRTGKEIGTSYGAAPAFAVLDKTQVSAGIVDGLVGASVGSRVLIAVAPKDGLAKGITGNGVKKNDTLLFLVDVKSIRTPLARATGDTVTPPAGLPTVVLDSTGKPTITVPPAGTVAPTDLVVQPLVVGTGPVVTSGQTITVHYTGVIWATGKQFDSSWDRGKRHRLLDRHREGHQGLGPGPRGPDRRLPGPARRAACPRLRHDREHRARVSAAPTRSCSWSTSSTRSSSA